jgi:hypothetical protein
MTRQILVLPGIALIAACGGGSASPNVSTPTTPTPGPSGGADVPFRVAVMLSATQLPTSEDVTRVFARADDILFQKTGERMTQVDLVTVGSGSVVAQTTVYIDAHASSPPDGVLAFSDDRTATSFGGYSLTFGLPAPHANRFPSPVAGENRGYLAVVDFFHKYARCGYDDAGNRVSDRSANGECRNRSGLVCVNNGRYWACPDALNDLYSNPDYFTGCSVVHEFMHPFGREGNFDHYGTAQCTTRTAMSQADAQNLTLFQQSCGMCPDLYKLFKHR